MIAQERLEWKYRFTGSAQPMIERILPFFSPVSFNGQEDSEVHSLYFEGHGWPSFRETLAGCSVRHKCRLRWYDQAQPQRPIFEVKRKQGFRVHKERYPLSSVDLDAPKHAWAELLSRQLPPAVAVLLLERDIPVCHIRYQRRHFAALGHPETRITVDTDIAVHPPAFREGPSAVSVAGSVLELKFPVSYELPRSLMEAVGMRRTRHSKYRRAVSSLGYHLPPE